MGTNSINRVNEISMPGNNELPRQLLTVRKTAKLLNYTERGIWNLIYQRRIPSIRFAGRVLVDYCEIEKLLAAGTTPALER